MREIKFRVWNEELEEMYKLKKSNYLGSTGIIDTYIGGDNAVWMQYTGLKDKNGVEIYEGDILTSTEYPFQDEGEYGYHGIIEYDESSAAFLVVKRVVNPLKRGISNGIAEYFEEDYNFEIIGNIYGNPELLEASE